MEDFILGLLGAKKGTAIAAFLGSIVSLNYNMAIDWHKTIKGWFGSLYLMLCGVLIASQLAPAISVWQQFSPAVEKGLSFIIALFGLSLASTVTQIIKETKLLELLQTLLPKKPGS